MNAEQLATVVRVACLTEDRDPAEQRALMDVAHHIDLERSSSSYRKPHPPELLKLVVATYETEGRRVEPPAAMIAQQDRLEALWRRCDRCSHPMGWHYQHDRCPTTPYDLERLAEVEARVWPEPLVEAQPRLL